MRKRAQLLVKVPKDVPQGLKLRIHFVAFVAQLKSCPDTKLLKIAVRMSFSAACTAQFLTATFRHD